MRVIRLADVFSERRFDVLRGTVLGHGTGEYGAVPACLASAGVAAGEYGATGWNHASGRGDGTSFWSLPTFRGCWTAPERYEDIEEDLE